VLSSGYFEGLNIRKKEQRSIMKHVISTGQNSCWDASGNPIPCKSTGQDGEFRVGAAFPSAERFRMLERRGAEGGGAVEDRLTGLVWSLDASPSIFAMSWQAALNYVADLNRQGYCGFEDWRLPNRRELRSLVWHESKNPPLPPGHPFKNIFHGWYWTSTTAAINTRYAWYVHMGGARMFYGRKDQECLVWPVRSESSLIPWTGQRHCFDVSGNDVVCNDTGQDGELKMGVSWPEPRFRQVNNHVLEDMLTGLFWTMDADLAKGLTDWNGALATVRGLNRNGYVGIDHWRLPNINELESLVDASKHSPALPDGHLFEHVGQFYWSSTTSFYDPQWIWALYMHKGAVGVGMKKGRHFHVMAVA
jgi:hypothetical protein